MRLLRRWRPMVKLLRVEPGDTVLLAVDNDCEEWPELKTLAADFRQEARIPPQVHIMVISRVDVSVLRS